MYSTKLMVTLVCDNCGKVDNVYIIWGDTSLYCAGGVDDTTLKRYGEGIGWECSYRKQLCPNCRGE